MKWPSLVACVPIALTVWLGDGRGRRWPPSRATWVTLGLAAAACGLAAFLVAPYIFLDFGTVLANVQHEGRAEHLSATSPGFWSALGFYAAQLWSNASVCLVFAPLAALAFHAKNGRAGAILGTLFVGYLVFISSLSLRWSRWLVPLLPYACLFIVLGMAFLIERVKGRTTSAVARWGTAACIAVMATWSIGSGAVTAVRTNAKLEEYARASAWLVGHIPPGSKILVERYTPSLPSGVFEVYVVSRGGSIERLESPSKYLTPSGSLGEVRSARRVLERVDYLVVGSLRGRYRRERERYQRESAAYDALVQASTSVARRGQYDIRKVKRDAAAGQDDGEVRAARDERPKQGKQKKRRGRKLP